MSGPAAAEATAILARYGAQIQVIDGPVGLAATRKLLRSVYYKGLAAAADLLDELGVPPRLARASRDWLAELARRR